MCSSFDARVLSGLRCGGGTAGANGSERMVSISSTSPACFCVRLVESSRRLRVSVIPLFASSRAAYSRNACDGGNGGGGADDDGGGEDGEDGGGVGGGKR